MSLVTAPALLTTPEHRVGLRPVERADVDAIMGWINDPEVTRNFAGMSETITREAELAYLDRMVASTVDELYAVVWEGRTIGTVGLHQIYWPARNGRLGVVLGVREARGRGLGTEALQLVTALGFEEHGLHKIWLVHYATNWRMMHLARKLGFLEEGWLRDEYFHRGAFHDMVRHALLEDEFRSCSWRCRPG